MRIDDPSSGDQISGGGDYRTLFLLLILAAGLATLAGLFLSSLAVRNPALQRLTAQVVCRADEHIETGRAQAGWLWPRQAWCVSEDGQRSGDIVVPLSLGVGALVFIPLALASTFWARRASAAIDPLASSGARGRAAAPTSSSVRSFQTIVVNGHTYASVDEMPADVRQVYEQMSGLFNDADGDGVPDLFETIETVTTQTGPGAQVPPGDPAARLQKLYELRASGLITEQEYQSKRTQILAEM